MKKIYACILMLLVFSLPAFAIVQGDEQFVYSSEIDAEINSNLGDTDNPVYKYVSVASPVIEFRDLDDLFSSYLAGMAFTASYTPVSNKTAIYPGIFTLQFSREEIIGLPAGSMIMSEMQASSDPLNVLFKYFNPVFVVYGIDGSKVSINVKNFPIEFDFITGDFNVMSLSFPIVLADGYPETFCIEVMGNYVAIHDAMVSEANESVIGDGKIEVAFALIPNKKATGAVVSEYPALEIYDNKGYVIFDDASEYLDITELAGCHVANISSGDTNFSEIEKGFSFNTPYSNFPGKGVSFVTVSVKTDEDISHFFVNGYPLTFKETLLPDNSKYLSSSFVLVDGAFVSDVIVKDDTVIVFDGENDGYLSANVKLDFQTETAPVNEVFHHGRGSFETEFQEGISNQVSSLVSGSFSQEVLPLLNSFDAQLFPVAFEGVYDGSGKSVFGVYEFKVFGSDLPSDMVSDIFDSDFDQPSLQFLLSYVRPVMFFGDIAFDLYDYLSLNDSLDILFVSGSLQAGVSIKIPVIIRDKSPGKVEIAEDCLVIYDGNEDGKFTLKSYLGIIYPETSAPDNKVVLSSSNILLKRVNLGEISNFYDMEEADDADFEYTGLVDWPGKDGVLNAVSVGSFEGTYGDPFGKYVPLKMEVSVTSRDLDRLSKDRHGKIISAWSEDKSVFLDYFHVYKQTGDLVYDLVMMGGKNAFVVTGDPTTKVTASFNAVLIDDVGNISYDEDANCFVIYDGEKDGKLIDPLFVGTPEVVPTDDGEEPEEPEEPEIKHILPEGPSTGHSDLDKWIKIFSLF